MQRTAMQASPGCNEADPNAAQTSSLIARPRHCHCLGTDCRICMLLFLDNRRHRDSTSKMLRCEAAPGRFYYMKTAQHLRDVGAGYEQVAGTEVADGARVGHAARPDAQLAHPPQRVRGGAVTCVEPDAAVLSMIAQHLRKHQLQMRNCSAYSAVWQWQGAGSRCL